MKIRLRLRNTGYTFVADSEKCERTDSNGEKFCEIVLTEDDVEMMQFWLDNNGHG